MEKIIEFLDKYFEEERKLHSYRKIPDLETYNKQVHILREFIHEEMYGNLGDVEQKFKAPDIFYPKKKSDPLIDGRNLFKISLYEHATFGELYIAYVSPSQAKKELLTLTDALFIICVEDKWCIAKKMIFSSYDSDDGKSRWIDGGGIEALNFDNEIKLIEINQLKEPNEKDPGLEIYQSNI